MYKSTRFPSRTPGSAIPQRPDRRAVDTNRARQNQPKIFYTNTSVEYWGGGRAAALVHTTLDGTADLSRRQCAHLLLAGRRHPARSRRA